MAGFRQSMHRHWVNDIPDGELYTVTIQKDRTVGCGVGRYAQGSGYTSCSWDEFLAGELNSLISETMGGDVLTEVRDEVERLKDQDS